MITWLQSCRSCLPLAAMTGQQAPSRASGCSWRESPRLGAASHFAWCAILHCACFGCRLACQYNSQHASQNVIMACVFMSRMLCVECNAHAAVLANIYLKCHRCSCRQHWPLLQQRRRPARRAKRQHTCGSPCGASLALVMRCRMLTTSLLCTVSTTCICEPACICAITLARASVGGIHSFLHCLTHVPMLQCSCCRAFLACSTF